jgi:hypothetical protein
MFKYQLPITRANHSQRISCLHTIHSVQSNGFMITTEDGKQHNYIVTD